MFIFNINNNNDESADQPLFCLKPDNVSYNTMLKGLCKVGNYLTAIALLRIMDGRGGCCKPDLVSYNTVIDGLCSDPGVVNTIDDTLKLFNEMVLIKGIRPDVDTYKSLILAFSKLGRWDELHKMVKQMVDESICVDMHIVGIIVCELCKQGNNKDALGIYLLMLNNSTPENYLPNLITFESLIHLASSRGRMSYAWKLYRRLKKLGMKPDNDTYNRLLDGFISHMKEDVAIKVFSLIPKQHIDKVTHFLLTGLITKTNHHHYRSETEYRDIKCSYLYHLYMHGYSYDQALDLFYFMENDKDDELNSEIEVYNILIFGANKWGRFDIARKLFHQLTVKGLEPDEVTYTLMIRGFCREGMVKDAKRMFIRMKRSGFLSDWVVDDVNQIPLCYLEEDVFSSSACVSVDMSGKEYGSSPPPLVATLLRLNVTEQFIMSDALI